MNRYDYVRPDTVADAIKALSKPEARALAGGTNLVDLMKSISNFIQFSDG